MKSMVFEGQPVFLGSRCFGRPANRVGGTKGNLTSVQKWSGRYNGQGMRFAHVYEPSGFFSTSNRLISG